MAVQIPDPGTGNGNSGDNEYVFRKKVQDNFTDQTNAASRLVGREVGNVMAVGAFGLGAVSIGPTNSLLKPAAGFSAITGSEPTDTSGVPSFVMAINLPWVDGSGGAQILLGLPSNPTMGYRPWEGNSSKWGNYIKIWTDRNATKDPNGFLKGASPVVDLYDSVMEQNEDAKKQKITFEKVATGDYLIKGSLGLAQEGWYIETPKDANGNVLVAVVYRQLSNNDISVKTYAKRFDEDTGDIVANLTKPRDIPAGRFISLRLHELPTEPTTPME